MPQNVSQTDDKETAAWEETQKRAVQQLPHYSSPRERRPLWNWIVLGVLFTTFCGLPGGFVGIHLLLTPPGHGRDARKAEGVQLMQSAANFFRVEYSRTKDFAEASEKFRQERESGAWSGDYYSVDPVVFELSGEFDFEITCSPSDGWTEGKGHMAFSRSSGNSTFWWD
jgi:hypothetical protein